MGCNSNLKIASDITKYNAVDSTLFPEPIINNKNCMGNSTTINNNSFQIYSKLISLSNRWITTM